MGKKKENIHYVLLGDAKVDPALALFGTISVREAKQSNWQHF